MPEAKPTSHQSFPRVVLLDWTGIKPFQDGNLEQLYMTDRVNFNQTYRKRD